MLKSELNLELTKLEFTLLTDKVRPNLQALEALGQAQLQRYELTLDEFFPDPEDPRRYLVALLVAELEALYAAGYEIVEDPGLLPTESGGRLYITSGCRRLSRNSKKNTDRYGRD